MMKKCIKLSISLATILFLVACSSQNTVKEQQAPKNDVDVSTTDENNSATYTNGLGETQIERYKIVVLPTQVDLTSQNAFPISPSALSKTLTHDITTALYETHRFELISAENYMSDGLEPNNVTELSDFYLQSTLNQLDTEETVRILKATGQGVTEKIVSATVLYQIIDAKSNKIVFSNTLRYQLKSTTNNESFSTTINNTLQSVADLMKNEIIGEIYPIRLVSVSNYNEIVLDYPLPLGSQCEVTRLGKKVKDVYTDSLLGYEQSTVGKLLITQTTSVLSYGEMLNGVALKGDICKPIQATLRVAPELVKQTPQGGVVLPFD
ncbi:hypothetical protein [Orbus mooreae]|uniref:hypothetical protein n=1 Tax=Orbus mooreae TaxID=3074107 RepID=UPI00370DC80F